MTWLTRAFRTTAFKLSVLYIVVFTVLSGLLVFYIFNATNRLMADQVRQVVDSEISGVSTAYAAGGLRAVVAEVNRNARRPDASLYLLIDFAGNRIAGNIAGMSNLALEDSSAEYRTVRYRRQQGSEYVERVALVRVYKLRGGFRVLVGRDLSEQSRFSDILSGALKGWLFAVVVLAGLTWLFASRRVLKRIDAIAGTSRTIMHGDLSGRLPVTGNGDEFDRLALNLNEMLARIDLLMQGMKQVTDNIAHDLKTPLTRLRARLETVLREDGSKEHYRQCVEATLEETDGLLRIFDALLNIARIEAMAPAAGMAPVSLKHVCEEIAELYAPVLEDEGGQFELEVPDLSVMGNRDLIAQALVNLVENALKYGKPEESALLISIKAEQQGPRILLSVSDNGTGIGADMRSQVTDRFVRLDDSRSQPGYGLGLSLVKAVAGLHGGHLVLEDAAPGLRVSFDLAPTKAGEERRDNEQQGS